MVKIPECGDCHGNKFLVEDIPTDKNDPPGQSWTCIECGTRFTFFPDGVSCPPVHPVWLIVMMALTLLLVVIISLGYLGL